MIPLGPASWAGYRWIHFGSYGARLDEFYESVGLSLIGMASSFHYDDDGFLGESAEANDV